MTEAIGIFAYNRPQSLQRLFASLRACPEFGTANVIVFIDGPKSPRDELLVKQTREVAINSASQNWQVVASEENHGLRASIYAGVTRMCREYGRAIVLEDDLVLAPTALSYFSQALARYADMERVWSIAGYAYETPALGSEERAFFLPFAHPWGWATWERAWTRFTLDSNNLGPEQLTSPSFKRFFNVNGLWLATSLLDLAQRDLVNSWFIQWHRTIFEAGGLSLFPTKSYVSNYGVGHGGTNASILSPYNLLLRPRPPSATKTPLWPSATEIDFCALDAMIQSKGARVERLVSVLGRLRRLALGWSKL